MNQGLEQKNTLSPKTGVINYERGKLYHSPLHFCTRKVAKWLAAGIGVSGSGNAGSRLSRRAILGRHFQLTRTLTGLMFKVTAEHGNVQGFPWRSWAQYFGPIKIRPCSATWFRSPDYKGGGPKKPAHVSGENGAGFYFLSRASADPLNIPEPITSTGHLNRNQPYGLITFGGITAFAARIVALLGSHAREKAAAI